MLLSGHCSLSLPSSGKLKEKRLIVTIPAVFRGDISRTCFKVFSEVFVKVLQVVLTKQALKVDTLLVRHFVHLKKM